MSYKDWYTIFESADKFTIQKIDPEDRTPQTTTPNELLQNTYTVNKAGDKFVTCSCFAGHTWCRHKKMVIIFQKANRINQRWLYNFDREKWLPPLIDITEA